MKLVNETGTAVFYGITGPDLGDCGTIEVDGEVDLPAYDNQQNVTVSFMPADGSVAFVATWPSTQSDEQTEMALVAEPGAE